MEKNHDNSNEESFELLRRDWQSALHEVAGKVHTVGFCATELQEGNLSFKKLYQNINDGVSELYDILDVQTKLLKTISKASCTASVVEAAISRFKLKNWKKRNSLRLKIKSIEGENKHPSLLSDLSMVFEDLFKNTIENVEGNSKAPSITISFVANKLELRLSRGLLISTELKEALSDRLSFIEV